MPYRNTPPPAHPRCDQTPVWAQLQEHFIQHGKHCNVRQAIAQDSGRFARMAVQAPHIGVDFSRNLLDETTETLLLQLAQECQIPEAIEAMFAGAQLNTTEQRAAWHVLLRTPPSASAADTGPDGDAWQAMHRQQQAFLDFAEQVRQDERITDIVNIGIGGSDLGPAVVVAALEAFTRSDKRLHFVSNMDGADLGSRLARLNPDRTLFLVASKSFGTAETIANARSARAWLLKAHGVEQEPDDIASLPAALQQRVQQHFVGLTCNPDAASRFGIQTLFPFEDWVGGRFSLWSSIGLSIAIAIGADGFRQLLAGAHAMDQHFRHAPLAQNLPVRLALLDVWYRNFHGFASRCIAPYSHALRRLPAYLQQLEMESNGKGCDLHGTPLTAATAPIVWGEAGTNGQHAYFQLIHQGSETVPVEFIVLREAGHWLPHQHRALLANALAQARALTEGKHDGPPHTHCPGNRPSTLMMLDRLDPHCVGALIALYEHRTYVAGVLWGINSFDQWGVELGKTLAKDILHRMESGTLHGLDATTQGLLGWLNSAETAHPTPTMSPTHPVA
ncbi:glucose-6-phosphate isomerase [Lampropedia hyalina DSM 16112]|uniref:Glucose-6-phosphate isomerase n=1 Tax=Lampropedia hyalina DSM 16112 TaxID=1122156 RepID=A0A1M4UKB7_9BURK|nr:glucose-6-phosphate isomerase [Lampropedia hyalina]SHE57105.1 glucose-6-phosphate isomerase [Lampropedia hyalina DSM 16112]